MSLGAGPYAGLTNESVWETGLKTAVIFAILFGSTDGLEIMEALFSPRNEK